ncbi:acyl-CoA thioesterase domain-containing protein [Microbacterium esteraromaticum]|uniref:acyl-CoA thioesterase domain-containing protein n=1 Tax=Microbacterium esteraromaticum TaxID=57043 RepID=UPI0031FC89CA
MSSYFLRLSETSFEPTAHVGGAWNPDEQHVAPVLGLLAHLVEAEHVARRPEAPLALARANYDILGVIPMARFDVEVRVVRPGRTIELVEATLSQSGRAALVLRAWMLQQTDTSAIAGHPLPQMPRAGTCRAGRRPMSGPVAPSARSTPVASTSAPVAHAAGSDRSTRSWRASGSRPGRGCWE